MFNFFNKTKKGKTAIFKIVNMHCTSCALAIDAELEETNGVISSNTCYAKSQTQVKFYPEKITLLKILNIIKKAGYKVNS